MIKLNMHFKRLFPEKYSALFFILILCWLTSGIAQAAEPYDASISKVTIEEKMIVGRTYSVKVKVNNTGSAPWNRTNGFNLSTTRASNPDWNLGPIDLDAGEVIKPGDSKVFNFSVSAMADTGVFPLQFEMQKDGKTFGQPSQLQNIIVETASNRVAFVSQLMPNTMNAGQSYAIVVQFKNEGSVNWTKKEGYQLGLKTQSAAWSVESIPMAENDVIAPGDTATFRFDLIAPSKPDTYSLQWQMQRWSKWFGEPAQAQQVIVVESASSSGAEFVYQNIPGLKQANQLYTIVDRGEIIPVNITFKNTSQENWSDGRYSLNSQNPPNNLIWSVERIELKTNEVIKPGQIKTFNFNIMAPLEPGLYQFQWQMVQGFNNWIGEKSEPIVITVK